MMHYDNVNPTATLKHCLAMKMHAKQQHQSLQAKVRKGLKLEYVGLMILKAHPFIAASPDCLVTCNWCGNGLLEVK